MLRELSAIGLSRYTSQIEISELIESILNGNKIHGSRFARGGETFAQVYFDMGPFQLAMIGRMQDQQRLHVDRALPVLKEKRNYLMIEWETQLDDEDDIVLMGQDRFSLEPINLVLTDHAQYFNSPAAFGRPELPVSCYGLSTEAKVLLGLKRTPQDWERKKRFYHWKKEKLRQAMEGDDEALRQLEKAEDEAAFQAAQRMQKEDLLSIYEQFVLESGDKENEFLLLGEITGIDKLFNPFSEEWVYYLDMVAADQFYRVLVHPTDLDGEPGVGRRFMGKVRFYGRVDPVRLLLEGNADFF